MWKVISFIYISRETFISTCIFTPWNNYGSKSGVLIKKRDEGKNVILSLKYCYLFMASFEIIDVYT